MNFSSEFSAMDYNYKSLSNINKYFLVQMHFKSTLKFGLVCMTSYAWMWENMHIVCDMIFYTK